MLLALSMQMFAGQACFTSGRCVKAALKASPVPKWRNGRRRGLKIPRLSGRAGSSPALGTNKFNGLRRLLCFPLFQYCPFTHSAQIMVFCFVLFKAGFDTTRTLYFYLNCSEKRLKKVPVEALMGAYSN